MVEQVIWYDYERRFISCMTRNRFTTLCKAKIPAGVDLHFNNDIEEVPCPSCRKRWEDMQTSMKSLIQRVESPNDSATNTGWVFERHDTA